VSKARLEAFSDGVIAVAITLLALNLRVPSPDTLTHGLAHALAQQWPSYVAYAISFTTIGIIWINHHAMIGRLRQPDHMILSLNLMLLLWIAELPFATDLMAAYLRQGHGENLAAAVYAGSFLMMAITFAALNRHILFPKSHLLATTLPEERRQEILRRSIRGLVPYALATVLAVVSPYVTLVICAVLAGYYALPIAQGGSDQTEEPLF
jgi:TMEM175 potassium channel family protein